MVTVKVTRSSGDPAVGLVSASGGERAKVQRLSDDVLEQMEGADVAYFRAEWVAGAWRIGTRVHDETW